jgi:hypothetical protein
METADVGEAATGAKALVANKENVPEAVANRRSSLAPWGMAGPTPSKLQDLAKRCVARRGAEAAGAAVRRTRSCFATGLCLPGSRVAAPQPPRAHLSRPRG